MKKYLLAIGSLSLLVMISSTPAFACSCLANESVENQYQAANAILVGTVVGKRKSPIKPGYLEVIVDVKKWYKIEDPDSPIAQSQKITIFTPSDEALCGISFQPKIEYLIYLQGSPAFLQATLCAGTKNLDLGMKDLPTLEALDKKNPAPSN